MEIIAQGAEAVIYRDQNFVIKNRVTKNYRLPEIDNSLRKFRTKREGKIISKLNTLKINTPKLEEVCLKKMNIKMEYINGCKLRDCLKISNGYEIGKTLANMHANEIMHGDLTTSNMILRDEKIVFIDFGLSFFSQKVEDKAVDLHLIKRALESKHSDIYEQCFEQVLKGYSETSSEAKTVFTRLYQVEQRGRNKNKK